MKKKINYVSDVLLGSVVTLLGLGACKMTHKTEYFRPIETVYGPPPVIIEKVETVLVEKEIRVVYGPPVVERRGPDWRKAKPDEEGVYDVAETMPQFPGGEAAMNEWIASNLTFPQEARERGIKGRVMVSFIVNTDGELDGVTVLRHVDPQLDAEAVRLVKTMPRWIPGRMGDKVVHVRCFLPINFND